MGHIVVGGATAEFPSLHHAFSVGEVLIKRDCRLLQSLAADVRRVNVFSRTETKGAVSYCEIPSRNEDLSYLARTSDTIPTGRGMQDIQCPVVDHESLVMGTPRLCKFGGFGAIYIGAGGLAEGYLGSDELDREKVVLIFFPSIKMPGSKQKVTALTSVVEESLGERSGDVLVIECTVPHSAI